MGLAARDQELGTIGAAVAAAAAGGSRAIGIFGAAGIGKSALLGEAAAAAESAGLQVLSGRAAEPAPGVPFGLFAAALDARVAAIDPGRVAAAGPELGEVLPAAAAASGPSPAASAGPAERYRPHRALRSLLELLGRERPFALLLDDLHRADEASVELVLHLLRRTPRAPHLLLFALEPDEPAAARLIDAARATPDWTELRPAPLGDEDATALLPSELDPGLRARMVRGAGGNPLFLCELGRLGAGVGEELPGTALAAVGQEVAGLPADAAALLQGAAIAGDPFDLELAAAVAEADPAAAPGSLETLVAAGLVQALDSGDGFGFSHPLVRRAVEEAAAPEWRLAAHRRAAAALADRGADPAERAHHVERCARPGDEAAIELLGAAAVETADAAPATAARWCAAALELLPEGELERRSRLLVPMARALISAGRAEEGRAALSEAIELLPAAAGAERLELRRLAGLTALLLGSYDEAEREIERALAEAPPSQLTKLLVHRSAIPFFRGDPSGVAVWVERAAAAADANEEAAVAAHLASQQAQVRMLSGLPSGEPMDAALARFEALADDELAACPEAAWGVGGTLNQVERYAEAAPVLRRGLEALRRTRQGQLLMPLNVLASRSALALLELDEALLLIDSAEETARLEGLPVQLALALWQRGQVLAARGERGDAARAAAESDRLYAAAGTGLGAIMARPFNALLRIGEDPERLLSEVAAAGGSSIGGIDATSFSGLLPPLVTTALAAGRIEDAERWVARTEDHAARVGLPASAARAARGRIELLLAHGEAADAAELAEAGVAAAAAASLRQEELELRLLLGRAQLAADDREEAIATLRALAAEAAAAKAVALEEATAQELRRAGGRVSGPGWTLRAPGS